MAKSKQDYKAPAGRRAGRATQQDAGFLEYQDAGCQVTKIVYTQGEGGYGIARYLLEKGKSITVVFGIPASMTPPKVNSWVIGDIRNVDGKKKLVNWLRANDRR